MIDDGILPQRVALASGLSKAIVSACRPSNLTWRALCPCAGRAHRWRRPSPTRRRRTCRRRLRPSSCRRRSRSKRSPSCPCTDRRRPPAAASPQSTCNSCSLFEKMDSSVLLGTFSVCTAPAAWALSSFIKGKYWPDDRSWHTLVLFSSPRRGARQLKVAALSCWLGRRRGLADTRLGRCEAAPLWRCTALQLCHTPRPCALSFGQKHLRQTPSALSSAHSTPGSRPEQSPVQ